MNRLLLYVHFNKYNALSGHVLYQLEHMRPLFSRVVVISNSTLSKRNVEELAEVGIIEIIQRKNKGYDFAAWRDGMKSVGFDNLCQYDSVTLMNDTCFGPLWDMDPIFEKFESRTDIDFWGMTNFRKTKYFKEHLQSYFLSFSRKVVVSKVFQSFWSSIQDFENVQDVIEHYETQVTTNLIQAGYRYDAVFNTLSEEAGDLIHPDFSYYRPLDIVGHKVPFLKVKAVQENISIASQVLRKLQNDAPYPVQLIKDYSFQTTAPDLPFLLEEKLISLSKQNQKVSSKVAVHLFVSDMELGQEMIKKLRKLPFQPTLFLSASTSIILSRLKDGFISQSTIVTDVFENHTLALKGMQDLLGGYDVVGHFHTDKSKEEQRDEVFETLCKYATVAIDRLENERQGLIFSDVPTTGRFEGIQKLDVEKRKQDWSRFPHQKELPQSPYFISIPMSFFWGKPIALCQFFNVNDKQLDESILTDYLVYLVWDQGYDFSLIPVPIALTANIDRSIMTHEYITNEKEWIHSKPYILKLLKKILGKFLP